MLLLLLVACMAPSYTGPEFVRDTGDAPEAQSADIDPSSIEVSVQRSCSVIVHFSDEYAVAHDAASGCDPAFTMELPPPEMFDGDILEVHPAPGWSVPTLGACWVELTNGMRSEVVVNLVLE